MQLEQIGKYKIIGKIGHGAMGEVFKAHDAVLNRMVAVKTIAADLGGDESLRKRFQREAQSAARLNHPNIITVYDYGEEQNKIYMAMELLEGTDLKQVISSKKPQSLDDKLAIMDQICDGLAFAHQTDIVHRDLKPANIHLLPNGQVKIMDFGLARLGGSEMTRTGMVMGTPHYMSPEQVRGERADSRSDIFSLGCVFYELLSYHKPFEAESMHAVLFKVMQEEPPPIIDLAPDVPHVLVDLLDRAMRKDPAERLQDASQFRTALHMALEAIRDGRGDEPLPESLATEAPRPLASGTGATAGGPDSRRPGSTTMRAASASASRARPRSKPPQPHAPRPPAPASRLPLYLAGGVVLLLGAAAAVLFLGRGSSAPASTAPITAPAQVDRLARELALSEVEIARRMLAAGDYKGAARKAERAVNIDPTNANAKEVLAAARKVVDDSEDALRDARTAAGTGHAGMAADALWRLMQVDPGHAAVAEMAPAHEAAFKARIEDARARMTAARDAAEKAGATALDPFREATNLAKDAEAAAKGGKFATAAARFLTARDRFERARRQTRVG